VQQITISRLFIKALVDQPPVLADTADILQSSRYYSGWHDRLALV
jgi:hypothetical protein